MDPLNMLKKPKKKAVKKEEPQAQPVKLPTLNDQIKEQQKMMFSEEKIAYLKKFYGDEEYIRSNAQVLPCETLEIYEKASYKEDLNLIGLLILTKYRLIFKFEDPQQLSKLELSDNYFKIPLFQIAKVNAPDKKNYDRYNLEITLKDTRTLKFVIHNKNNVKFYGDLMEAVFPKDQKKLFDFSFEYLKYLFRHPTYTCGWDLYNPKKEFERQGITEIDLSVPVRITEINKKYELCPTYPPILVVPKKSSDSELREAAEHRTKNRLPTLTYYYNKHGCKSSLWRSSQSKAGLKNKKSEGDVKLMENIISLNQRLYIFDARPYFNALANKIKGGGYEDVEHYTNAELSFCEIDNIHVARKSLQNVYSLAQSKDM